MSIENDILIVCDEIPNLRLLSEWLEREGYKARPATSDKLRAFEDMEQKRLAGG